MSQEDIANEKLVAIEQDVTTFVAEGKKIVIEDDEGLQAATNFLANCKVRWKRIEDLRTDLVKPLNDTVKKINAGFKGQQAPLTAIEAEIKGAMGTYQKKKLAEAKAAEEAAEAEAKAEQERLAAEAEKEEDPAKKKALEDAQKLVQAPVAAPVPATTVRGGAGTASFKTVWKFEVEDAAKVPSNYKVVDEKLIRKAVVDGERSIPGVRIYEDQQVAVR